MLFWICIFVMVVGYLWCKKDKYNNLAGITLVVGIVLTIVSLVILCVYNIGWQGRIAKCYERYDSLLYQAENDIYEHDIYKHELIEQIQGWNEDVVWCKKIQDNFWIGIYIPNIYDDFETIPLELID